VREPSLHHLTEDLLEQYVLAKLAESDLEAVEEHLLTCRDCRDRLIDVERFVTTIQAAARKLESSDDTGEPAFCRYTIRRSWTAERRL
jgi:anti-sigma factor RsiW